MSEKEVTMETIEKYPDKPWDLYTNPKGVVDIEHNHMLGFLLKVVIELRGEINKFKQ